MDTLEITWRMDGCAPGIDNSQDNPLSRATDRLFRLGRPFFRLNKCFFREPNGTLRWFGIFVHSAGDRVLFFPGFGKVHTHLVGYKVEVPRWNQPFHLDHLTLEPNRRTWHVTSPKSDDHLGKLYTRKLGSGRVHWFSMSTANASELRLVRECTQVRALTPPQDVDRRTEVFRNAREGAMFQLLQLNTEQPHAQAPAFLHFSVVVGPSGFPPLESEILGLPRGSPFLPEVSGSQPINAPIRVHRVQLSDKIDLEITATCMPGQLRSQAVFTAPVKPCSTHEPSARA